MTPGDLNNLFDDEDDDERAQGKNRSRNSNNGDNDNDNGRDDPDPDPDRPTADDDGEDASARQPQRRSSPVEGGSSPEHDNDGDTPATTTPGSSARPPALLVGASSAYPVRGGRHDAAEPSRMRKSSFYRSKGQQESTTTPGDADEKCDEPRVGGCTGGGRGGGGESGEHESSGMAGGHDGDGDAEVTAENREGSSDEAEGKGHEQRRDSGVSQPPRQKGFGPIVMNCSQVRPVCRLVVVLGDMILGSIISRDGCFVGYH